MMNNLEPINTEYKESNEPQNEYVNESSPCLVETCCGADCNEEEETHHSIIDSEVDPENELEVIKDSVAGSEVEPGIEQPKKGAHRESFEKFIKDLEQIPEVEAKLQFVIDFMEASIAQTGSPHFKSFWEARNICLSLFKENISPALRSILWTKYNELSKEAKHLKDMFDEQSAYAVEQIETAVAALESDINSFDEQLLRIQDIEIESAFLQDRLPKFKQLQRELNLLNTQASRINALRKELIRIDMRIKLKNKFFQRLSAAGDRVFPRRKELIKEVSDLFMGEVEMFIEKHFKDENSKDPLFSLREEIKALQGMAKVLTLNTHSFSQTRMRLSECWDRIKGEEKERKKERSQQRAHWKQNFTAAMEKLQAFKNAFEALELSFDEATKQIEAMGIEFKNLELARDDYQLLRETFIAARKPLLDKVQSEELARLQAERLRKEDQRNQVLLIKQQVNELLQRAPDLDVDALSAERDVLIEKINQAPCMKAEKIEMERQLKPLRDLIIEKKESSLLSLSEDDRQSLKQLKEVLKQRKERRQAIKLQVDSYRKNSGRSSGLDFDQAFSSNELIAAEKDRLDKINHGIKEIEDKIALLEV